MQNTLEKISAQITSDITDSLTRSGLMFRIFSRVKADYSVNKKIKSKYAGTKSKLQDMIGIRIVVYFQDDVDVLALYYSVGDVVKKAIDELNSEKLSKVITEYNIELMGKGRIMVRASGTEPKVRVMVESKDKEENDRIALDIKNTIITIDEEI